MGASCRGSSIEALRFLSPHARNPPSTRFELLNKEISPSASRAFLRLPAPNRRLVFSLRWTLAHPGGPIPNMELHFNARLVTVGGWVWLDRDS